MELTKLLDGYEKRVRKSEKHIEQLGKRAERLAAAHEQRADVQERIKDAEQQISACVGVKAALKDEFANALFNDDAEQQQTIREQRGVLDDEIQELEKQVEQGQQELTKASVDGRELAEVRAILDSFKAPSYDDLLDSVEAELKQTNRDLERLARDGREQLPSSHLDHKETYSTVREANDSVYRSQQQTERRLAREDAERRAKMYEKAHAILAPPEPPEDNMGWTHKGTKAV